MRQRVMDYYRKMAPEYTPTRMAELAVGVIAVEDKSGECDVMFDPSHWEFTSPGLWNPNSALRTMGMDVLEGKGAVPAISTIEDMLSFAKRHLSPLGGESWHAGPQFFFP